MAHTARQEAALLAGADAPVVVLERRPGAPALAGGLAPGQDTLGFMLPYSPLHHLLLAELSGPIVLTSGNRSDEPQCTGNDEARERLAGIADAFLMHDRDILNRLDDSVVRVVAGAPRRLRRARGQAPGALPLPPGFEQAPRVLAMGAELKNTFCLAGGGRAVMSQHVGDLEDAAVHAAYREALDLYRDVHRFEPEVIAVDHHPDYLSTQWGRSLAAGAGLGAIAVQHHHAHAAAVMLEHGRPLAAPPVLAVLLDGLGLGDEGELWGGEFLLCDYRRYRRLASFEPVPLPGGSRAMREPWRNAFAALRQHFGLDAVRSRWPGLAVLDVAARHQPAVVERMLERGLNAPSASSAGRLFDAVAATLGVCAEWVGYEGQAAIELETLAARAPAGQPAYPWQWRDGEPARIGWRALWKALLDDLAAGVAREHIAARFHAAVVAAVVDGAARLAVSHGRGTVVLGGGVMQNCLLLEGVIAGLEAAGLRCLAASELPANDGGLAAGQAAVAMARAMGT